MVHCRHFIIKKVIEMVELKTIINVFQSLGIALFALIITFILMQQLRERRIIRIVILILSAVILAFLVIKPTFVIEKITYKWIDIL